jgi:tRNA(Arg) A34 adenosine deaminase TadA
MSDLKLTKCLLNVIEKEIVPKTQKGVSCGNKLFGAAIVRKSDLSLVIAGTNNETENPLWHGEMATLKAFYEMPSSQRPAPKDCYFLATHEPCSLCLSGITWTGFDNFYYLFGYEDTRDAFNIPHDLKILKEVFKIDNGEYARENEFWKSHDLNQMIKTFDPDIQSGLEAQVKRIAKTYDDMSAIYQASKGSTDIPLN